MFPRNLYAVPLPGGRVLSLGERPLVMGILNVTPDSFAAGSARLDPAAAIDAALRMEAEGADLIDIGGESTRPGSASVPADEEIARVRPVLEGVCHRIRVPVSIDTRKAPVACMAFDAGASLANDVSGLRYDAALAAAAARAGAALVIMHSRGEPATMAADAQYGDLVAEVVSELQGGLARAEAVGLARDRVIVDPGIGFAKRPEHSYGVLARLASIASALDRPLLVGPSRKSFLRAAVDDRPAPERDWGTAAAVAAAVLAGAHIVRVHAVAEMRQVVRVAEEIRRASR